MKFGAKLLLENGISFDGIGFGFKKIGVGEVVFNTSITGYQEILTDPSYDGQIITFTYPHIGNTGINFEDNESKNIAARGLIVKNFCDFPSNHRSKMSLEEFLVEQKTICISDIDTRHLTKILRDEGCKIGAIYPTQHFTDEEAMSEIKIFEFPISEGTTILLYITKDKPKPVPGVIKTWVELVFFPFLIIFLLSLDILCKI